MRRQAVRTVAPMLVVLLAASAPARAATITLAEVARAVGANGQMRPASEVRLRLGAQSGAAATPNASTQSGNTAPQQTQQPTTTTGPQQTTPPATPPAPPSDQTLSQSGGNVQTVDLGDVTGTVCDCGEIAPAGEAAPTAATKGGFPKFPLLALAALPGIACCRSSTPPPTPPNTPETPVPEPLTLATFAAGLSALAGLRSRRRRS